MLVYPAHSVYTHNIIYHSLHRYIAVYSQMVWGLHLACNTRHTVLNARPSTRYIDSFSWYPTDKWLFSLSLYPSGIEHRSWRPSTPHCGHSYINSTPTETFADSQSGLPLGRVRIHGVQAWTSTTPDNKHMWRWYPQMCFRRSLTIRRASNLDSHTIILKDQQMGSLG